MALLETRELTKSYDAVAALQAVSLSVESGTVLGLIGENGAGKSTFAKCVTGLIRPTSGEILLEGRPVHGATPAIAGIPQEFNLVEDLTVAENIFLGREPSRFGQLVSVDDSEALEPAEMARRMVGRELTRMFPPPSAAVPGEVELEVEHLAALPAVRDVSFTLRRGELLGVAGLAGAGRTELAEAIAGLRKIDSGTVRLAGREVRFRTPAQAVAAGISYLSEDRQGTGILPDFSIEANITLVSLARYCRGGIFDRSAAEEAARNYVARFRIKPRDISAPLRALSGGNQQKVAVARGLDIGPTVFMFDEPTRGVDVAARCEIYEFIRELADSGVACLLISSDMEELLGMCRKIMVMREGQVAGFVEGDLLTEAELMYLAIGVKE